MQAPGAGWARVQLVRGQSGAQHWAIDGQYPEARLTIGSAPDAGWPVQGIGVQPYHLELFWDGRSLWVADTRRVGSVTIDGRAVTDWVQIRGRSEISFGAAGMQVETADAQNEMASNPGAAKRVTVAPGDLDLGAMAQWDDASLPGEATRVAPPPSELAGAQHAGAPAWTELDPESTRIGTEGAGYPGLPALGGIAPAAGMARPASAAPPPMLRPRLGGVAPPIAAATPPPPGGRDMARTITAEEMSQHIAAAQQMGGAPGDPSVVVQPGYPSASGSPQGGYPGAPGYAGAPGFPGASPAPGFQALGAPAQQAGGGGPQSGFMAPPSFDQAASGAEKPKRKQSVPTRTWILLAALVLGGAAVMLLMTPAEEEVVPAVQPPTATPQAGVPGPLPTTPGTPQVGAPTVPTTPTTTPTPTPQTSTTVTPTPGAPTPATPTPGAPTPGAPTAATPTPGEPTTATPTPGEPTTAEGTEPAAPVGPTPDRLAADLVITGRYAEALPHYQALAAAHPERPEYAQMVRILQQRLASRCQGGVGPDGRPCVGR